MAIIGDLVEKYTFQCYFKCGQIDLRVYTTRYIYCIIFVINVNIVVVSQGKCAYSSIQFVVGSVQNLFKFILLL